MQILNNQWERVKEWNADSNSDIKIVIKDFLKNSKIENLIVTRGSEGAILFSHNKKIF